MLKENLLKRKTEYSAKIGDLAHERLQHQRRIEDIDKAILQLQGAIIEIDQCSREVSTEEAINQAKKKEEEPNNV